MPAQETDGKNGNIAVLGGGCFWCLEAAYKRIAGVIAVDSGYAGGNVDEPTYEQVCTGKTGHAEVVKVTYDPAVISYEKLLELFWKVHDPTSLNRQGADVGTQYRSALFYVDEEQKKTAEQSMKKEQSKYREPIVTQLVPLAHFWPAEEYHRDYFDRNPFAGYCQAVIKPKLDKLDLGVRKI